MMTSKILFKNKFSYFNKTNFFVWVKYNPEPDSGSETVSL